MRHDYNSKYGQGIRPLYWPATDKVTPQIVSFPAANAKERSASVMISPLG